MQFANARITRQTLVWRKTEHVYPASSMPGYFAGHFQRAGLAGLLARAALRVLQLRLPHLDLLAFGLADDESAAAQILGFIQFIVRQRGFS